MRTELYHCESISKEGAECMHVLAPILYFATSDTQSAGFSSLSVNAVHIHVHNKTTALYGVNTENRSGDWSFCGLVSGEND